MRTSRSGFVGAVLALALAAGMAAAPVNDAAAQSVPIGTLLIPTLSDQPISVYSAGVSYENYGAEEGGPISFSVFTVTKPIDAMSPTFLVNTASGASIPQARIDLFDSTGTTVLTSYELTDVVILNVNVGSATDVTAPAATPVETVAFEYGIIKQIVFTPAGPVQGCWDRLQNLAC